MKNIKGFTLIEVIVTITLLAVLMAIVVPISLSYMDNIQEKKILNEAEAVLSQARSGAHSDRLSLEGKYLSHSGTYTETDSTLLSLYVSKANGVGVDEVPKVGVSESSDFISNKLLDKFIHMDTPYSVFSLV